MRGEGRGARGEGRGASGEEVRRYEKSEKIEVREDEGNQRREMR